MPSMRSKIIAVVVLWTLAAIPAFAQFSKSTLNSQVTTNFPDNTAGSITPAITRSQFSNFINSWQQYAAVNAQTGTTYTVQVTDYGQLITFNNGSAVAVTLGAASASFPFSFYVQNKGAGTVTITPTSGTINGASNLAIPQNRGVFIVSDNTNWQIFGLTDTGVILPASGTSGGIPYFNSTSTTASSALLAANGVVIGGGAGTTPATITACTAGQLIYGTAGAPVCQTPATTTTSPGNPSAVTPGTSTAQMLGLAGAITPVASGRVWLQITGTALIASTTNGATFQCKFGTGSAPANAASSTGTSIGNATALLAGATTAKTPFNCGGVITGAALATALWLDVAVLNTTGSQAVTVTNVTVAAYEF